MSFWDSVKKFTQPYSDEEYDDYEDEDVDGYEEETPAPAPRERRHTASYRASSFDTDDSADTGFSAPSVSSVSAAPSTGFVGQVVSSSSGAKQEVVLFRAKSFSDATKAADDLKRHKAVILNMENVDKALHLRSGRRCEEDRQRLLSVLPQRHEHRRRPGEPAERGRKLRLSSSIP